MAARGSEGSDHEASPDLSSSFRPQMKVINVEKGADRFNVRHDQYGPTVATWRSNLVASSQRRNLLFTGQGSQIYVWIPDGPYQLLGSIPEMIITPALKNPSAAGYIDPSSAHTINQMIVDDLGRDEVLLVATDSGNICGYHVEALYSAIALCTTSNYKRPFSGAEVTPFFTETVRMSAWGLAIHKYARLIAVSSNTHDITIFAFALIDDTSEGRDDAHSPQATGESTLQASDCGWVHIEDKSDLEELKKIMPHGHRARNLRITYRGHVDNIPCLAFANFDSDPNGNTMYSTDIINRVLVWDIWSSVNPIKFYWPGHPMNNPPERGWTVMPLDPRSFKRHQRADDACGCAPNLLSVAGRTILDVTDAVKAVPGASQVLIIGADDNLPNQFLPTVHLDHVISQSLLSEVESRSPDFTVFDPDGASSDTGALFSEIQNDRKKLPPVILKKQNLPSLFDEDNEYSHIPGYTTSEFGGLGSALDDGFAAPPLRHPKYPRSFPVLHLSEHHISLAPYPLDSEYHLLCSDALHQQLSFHVPISSHCDRFNMVKYVPELSIVVAASQKGRVVILSLTWHQDLGFMFRPDWIVPFSRQETKKERPMIPLLGIGVSPMPGFEIPPDVPTIPLERDDVSFKYRSLDDDDSNGPSSVASESPSRSSEQEESNPENLSKASAPKSEASEGSGPESESESKPQTSQKPEEAPSKQTPRRKTLAECHAQASAAHRPHESWHGLHVSRHYRLILYFCDNTSMSYEFWHDWQK